MTTKNSTTIENTRRYDELTLQRSCFSMINSIFNAIIVASDENSQIRELAHCGQYLTDSWANVADVQVEKMEYPERFQE